MRILHLNDRLSERGGADVHMQAVITAQCLHHQVVLAVGRDDGTTAFNPCNVEIVAGLDAKKRRSIDLHPLINEFRPDVIHLHNIVNPDVLEWAASRKSVITIQDHRTFCPGRGKWKLNGDTCQCPMNRENCTSCFNDSDYFTDIFRVTVQRREMVGKMTVIVLSDYMRQELSDVGVPGENIHVIPPFVSELEIAGNPKKTCPCILFVGRLVKGKGVYDAVEVWRRSGIRLPLVFAGTGPEREKLNDMGCRVLGWLKRDVLASWYQQAEALLMPSRWQEPFGIVGLEALTFGVPVVAWNSGGIPEWFPGKLTPWGDLVALEQMLKNAVGTTAVAPAGFDRDTLMRRLYDLYEQVMATR